MTGSWPGFRKWNATPDRSRSIPLLPSFIRSACFLVVVVEFFLLCFKFFHFLRHCSPVTLMSECLLNSKAILSNNTFRVVSGPLHMSPVNRAGSVTEMNLVSVQMATFSPLSEIPFGKTEISASEPARSLIWTRRDFFKGIKGCAEISETGPARSTGLIWRGP